MQDADIAAILHETMLVALKLAGPALSVALAVGLVISLIQAATQINEQTLAFVPKVLAIGAALALSGSFMLGTLDTFTHQLTDRIVAIGAR
jgi:flagellar biosynthetic protein FliQ